MFDGPSDEDMFPRFGLSASAVRERFADVVAVARTQLSDLDEHDAALIQQASASVPPDHIAGQPPDQHLWLPAGL